jgi:enterochelin esterase family protein
MAIHVLRHESRVLEGNPCGDPAARDVWVYTPPGYERSEERYPVLWCLTGFTGTGAMAVAGNRWAPGLADRMDRLVARGCPPAIVAFPDCFTRWGGSQYVNSAATGRYEDYLCDELVPFVESAFRASGARGVFGKSSGGYGAVRLAMRRPGLFRAAASHSGDMGFGFCYPQSFPATAAHIARAGSIEAWVRAFEAGEKKRSADFDAINTVAMAACYSPDPDAPFGVGLPFDLDTVAPRPAVWQRWLAHDPVRMVGEPAHAEALRALRLLFLDCGTKDEYHLDCGLRLFRSRLDALGIPAVVEEFDDDHRSVSYRYDVSIPKLLQALRPEA